MIPFGKQKLFFKKKSEYIFSSGGSSTKIVVAFSRLMHSKQIFGPSIKLCKRCCICQHNHILFIGKSSKLITWYGEECHFSRLFGYDKSSFIRLPSNLGRYLKLLKLVQWIYYIFSLHMKCSSSLCKHFSAEAWQCRQNIEQTYSSLTHLMSIFKKVYLLTNIRFLLPTFKIGIRFGCCIGVPATSWTLTANSKKLSFSIIRNVLFFHQIGQTPSAPHCSSSKKLTCSEKLQAIQAELAIITKFTFFEILAKQFSKMFQPAQSDDVFLKWAPLVLQPAQNFEKQVPNLVFTGIHTNHFLLSNNRASPKK